MNRKIVLALFCVFPAAFAAPVTGGTTVDPFPTMPAGVVLNSDFVWAASAENFPTSEDFLSLADTSMAISNLWDGVFSWLDTGKQRTAGLVDNTFAYHPAAGPGVLAIGAVLSSMLLLQYLFGGIFCSEYESLKNHLAIAERNAARVLTGWTIERCAASEAAALRKDVDLFEAAALTASAHSRARAEKELREHLALTERYCRGTEESVILRVALAELKPLDALSVREREEIQEGLVLSRRKYEKARVQWLAAEFAKEGIDSEVGQAMRTVDHLRMAMDQHLTTHGCGPKGLESAREVAHAATA